TWIAAIQWDFFIFTNTVVIPITIGSALHLSQGKIVSLLQVSFVLTGIACVIQALLGHQRSIMEGHSGLWWGVFLAVVASLAAQGVSLQVIGGSLTVGFIISGLITMMIGLIGLGPLVSKLFSPAVMSVFLFLLGVQLVGTFFKGMIGLPFGHPTGEVRIDFPIALLSILTATFVIFLNVKAKESIRQYSLLIGIVLGWIIYVIIFKPSYVKTERASFMELFPLGEPVIDAGIVLLAICACLLNLANTSVSLKGTDVFYKNESTRSHYRASFTITGAMSTIGGSFGLIPYAPYVSSIGFLEQTKLPERLPFVLAGCMFILLGVFPTIGTFLSNLPLSIGSAVLFVAYLLLFHSSINFLKTVILNRVNVYRLAIPIFLGVVIMTIPDDYFLSIPHSFRPLISNGLIVGISHSVLMEAFIRWDHMKDT